MAWNDLTEREKELDRGIDKYGGEDSRKWRKLFNTKKTTIDKIMDYTGAKTNERNFIIRRVELRLKTFDLLDATDDIVNDVSLLTSYLNKDLINLDKRFWEGYLNCIKGVNGAKQFSFEELRDEIKKYYNMPLEEFAHKSFNMSLQSFIKKYKFDTTTPNSGINKLRH